VDIYNCTGCLFANKLDNGHKPHA